MPPSDLLHAAIRGDHGAEAELGRLLDSLAPLFGAGATPDALSYFYRPDVGILRTADSLIAANNLAEFYSMFAAAPGLRGAWYGGNINHLGVITDLSFQIRPLTMNGNPMLDYLANGVAYIDYDGTGDFHSYVDTAAFQITGTEATIAPGKRGLTMGGWFWFDAAVTHGLIGKYDTAVNQRAYRIRTDGANILVEISLAGTAPFTHTGSAYVIDQWYFLVARFTPSTELALWVNGVKTITVASVPASIFNSTASFLIGATLAGSNPLDGRCALAFLAAAAWNDALINDLFQRSRQLFV